MQIIQGSIRLQDLLQTEAESSNPFLVSVLATTTEIDSITLTGLVPGDRVFVFSRWKMLKGITTGITTMTLTTEGGGVDGTWQGDAVDINAVDFFHPASVNYVGTLNGLFKVLVGGDITIKLMGLSLGSDGIVVAFNAGMFAIAFRSG